MEAVIDPLIEIHEVDILVDSFDERLGGVVEERVRKKISRSVVGRADHPNPVGEPPGQCAVEVDRICDVVDVELIEEHCAGSPGERGDGVLQVPPVTWERLVYDAEKIGGVPAERLRRGRMGQVEQGGLSA